MTPTTAREQLERIIPDLSPEFWQEWEERLGAYTEAVRADALAETTSAERQQGTLDPLPGVGAAPVATGTGAAAIVITDRPTRYATGGLVTGDDAP